MSYVDVPTSSRHMLVRRASGLSLPGGTSPGNTVLPVITGTPIVGQTLTCSTGTWTNSPTGYAYQWKRGLVNIGTNANTYTLVAADANALISCVVTATNVSGSGSTAATAVGPVLDVPANTVAPVLSGTPTVGQTLSCTTGTWTNSPTSYAYSWFRGATFISSGASNTYVIVAADTGSSITCFVTATNAAGPNSGEVFSNSIGPVVAGGAALLEGETNGIGADFSYATDAQRIAKKVANVTTYHAPDTIISNAATFPKIVYDVAGNIGWAPHNIYWPSEDLRSNWILTNTTAPTATFLQTTATASVLHRVSQNLSGASGQYTYTIDASPAGYNKVGIAIAGSTGEVAFDLSLGTIIYQSATGWSAAIAPSPLGGGIYRITATGPGNASGFNCYILNPAYTTGSVTTVWTADGASGINIFRQQLNRGMTACPYLQSTTASRTGVALDHDPVTHAPYMLSEATLSQSTLWNGDFTNAVWVKTNMTASASATGGPIDMFSTLTATAANATVLQSITAISAARVVSCFIKRRTGSGNIDLTLDNGTTWTAAAVTASWVRYSGPIATVTNPIVGIRIATSGDAVDVAYFQQEATTNFAGVSSPVPSVAAVVTRTADNYSLLLSAIPALASEYSFYTRFATPFPATAASTGPIALTDGTVNEQAKLVLSGSTLRQQVVDGGAAQATIIGDTVVANTFMSAANRIKLNDCAMSTNGSAVGTDTSVTLPTLTEVRFGTAGSSTAGVNIYRIQKFSIITNRGWSDAELQTKSVT